MNHQCGFRAPEFEGEGHHANRTSDLYAETASTSTYAKLWVERKTFLSGKRDISDVLQSQDFGSEE